MGINPCLHYYGTTLLHETRLKRGRKWPIQKRKCMEDDHIRGFFQVTDENGLPVVVLGGHCALQTHFQRQGRIQTDQVGKGMGDSPGLVVMGGQLMF